jgi:hypothetical protein
MIPMSMLMAAVAEAGVSEVLALIAGQEMVAEALVEGLCPAVGMLLLIGIGLGGCLAAETAGGPDGPQRTRGRNGRARDVATVFGRITMGRKAYRAPGAGNVHPLDEVLDLPAGLYSPRLARLCVRRSRPHPTGHQDHRRSRQLLALPPPAAPPPPLPDQQDPHHAHVRSVITRPQIPRIDIQDTGTASSVTRATPIASRPRLSARTGRRWEDQWCQAVSGRIATARA